jgi:hypothetical protein
LRINETLSKALESPSKIIVIINLMVARFIMATLLKDLPTLLKDLPTQRCIVIAGRTKNIG